MQSSPLPPQEVTGLKLHPGCYVQGSGSRAVTGEGTTVLLCELSVPFLPAHIPLLLTSFQKGVSNGLEAGMV